jgi:hypothetical protein
VTLDTIFGETAWAVANDEDVTVIAVLAVFGIADDDVMVFAVVVHFADDKD